MYQELKFFSYSKYVKNHFSFILTFKKCCKQGSEFNQMSLNFTPVFLPAIESC